jgi:hypothetical protein
MDLDLDLDFALARDKDGRALLTPDKIFRSALEVDRWYIPTPSRFLHRPSVRAARRAERTQTLRFYGINNTNN